MINFSVKNASKYILFSAFIFKTTLSQAHNSHYDTSVPDWMYQQISEDLAPFKASGIKKTELNQLLKSEKENGNNCYLAKFKIKDQKLKIEYIPTNHEGVIARLKILKKTFNEILKTTKIPDVEFLVSMLDSLDGIRSSFPIFSFAKSPLLSTGIVLMPDFEALTGYHAILEEVNKGNTLYPWSKKIERLGWKGSMTGYPFSTPIYPLDPRKPRMGGVFTLDNFLDFPRTKLVTLSLTYPWLIEARYTQLCQSPQPELIQITFPNYFDQPESICSQLRYKYQILIDGNSAPYSRTYWQLFSNSVIFKQDSDHIQWYFNALQPYVHYIPVAYTLDDLIDKIDWAIKNDYEMQTISRNAQNFAHKNLTRTNIIQYLQLLLIEYASLQKN